MRKYKIGDKVKDSSDDEGVIIAIDDGEPTRKVKIKYKNILYGKQWRYESRVTRVIESEE